MICSSKNLSGQCTVENLIDTGRSNRNCWTQHARQMIISDFLVRLRTCLSCFGFDPVYGKSRFETFPPGSLIPLQSMFEFFTLLRWYAHRENKQTITVSCCLLLSQCNMTELFVPMYDTNSQPGHDMFVLSNLVSV